MSRDTKIGVLCFLAFVVTYALLMAGPVFLSRYHSEISTQLPLLAITGIMALLASLALVSVTFSLANLSDRNQALGLPEGSVRAVIALSLIVLFAITSIFFHSSLGSRGLQRTEWLTAAQATDFKSKLQSDELVSVIPTGNADKPSVVVYRLGTQAAEDFAKQVFTLIGTLMTAVASFYFATQAASPSRARPDATAPTPLTEVEKARMAELEAKTARTEAESRELQALRDKSRGK